MDLLALVVIEYLEGFYSLMSPDKEHFSRWFGMKEDTYYRIMETLYTNGFIDENKRRILTIKEWVESRSY